jgi:hypothetical protein
MVVDWLSEIIGCGWVFNLHWWWRCWLYLGGGVLF